MIQNDEFFKVLHRGVKSGQKYPENVRHFCISLLSHSPRAYQLVRRTFHNHLPSAKTIRCWFANSDIRGDPGISTETLNRLTKIGNDFEEKNKRKLLCSLVYDEMHIKQQLYWSHNELQYSGFKSYGEKFNEDVEKKIAKQVIVFILNGIDVNFEFPVSYHFINELNAAQRTDLIHETIAAVTKCGVKITNITFDGHPSNIPALQLLGANLKWNTTGSNKQFKPFFFDPVNHEKIFIMLDPCHMIKLVRNRLASSGKFFDIDGNQIEWKYIVALYNYSINHDFHTHKLTKKHIEWERHSMNVRIAVETLSNSVANSIQFLMEQNIEEFQGMYTEPH